MQKLTMTADQASIFTARFLSTHPAAPAPVWDGTAILVADEFAQAAGALVAAGFALTKDELKAYAASSRFKKEVGGVVVSGVGYPSDRETQSKMTAAVVLSQVNPAATFKWKLADGSFANLDAAGILAVATAVGAFVQSCFATEGAVVAAIDAGTTTAQAQVDSAFA